MIPIHDKLVFVIYFEQKRKSVKVCEKWCLRILKLHVRGLFRQDKQDMCKLFWVVFSQKFAPAIGENIPRFVTSSAHFDSQLDCFTAPHKKIDRVFALPNEYVVSCLRLELGSIIISALIEDWVTDLVVNVIKRGKKYSIFGKKLTWRRNIYAF